MDRSIGAAQPCTKHCSRIRSSTSDLAPGSSRTCGVVSGEVRRFSGRTPTQSRTALLTVTRGPQLLQPNPSTDALRRVGIATSGRDSGLEAFSHNPADGSFAPVAPQPSARTKCLNLRFLSYCAGLPLQQHIISMVKLTRLTTLETQLTFPISG